MNDQRKKMLKFGLAQLCGADVERLVRHVEEGKPVLLDRDDSGAANFSNGCFCPLAIAFGVPELCEKNKIAPTDDVVRDMLWGAGFRIYNTRGVAGDFYRDRRRDDLLLAAKEVLAEKRGA